ncbi:MAG: inositol monophosphatase family protein [Bacillota bacterium]
MNDDRVKIVISGIIDSVTDYFKTNDIGEIKHHFKDKQEIATKIDTDVEAIIIEKILNVFPEHKIVSEERGVFGKGEYVWYVDPVDNTVGLIAGEKDISVSVSLKKSNEHISSVVINPRTMEIFEANSSGCFKNGRALRTCTGTLYGKARGLSTCAYVRKSNIERAVFILSKLYEKRIPVRISGGSALDLCYVAEGRCIGHVSVGAHVWDVEAGIHMVLSAGGEVEVLARFPESSALAIAAASSRKVLDEIKGILGKSIDFSTDFIFETGGGKNDG